MGALLELNNFISSEGACLSSYRSVSVVVVLNSKRVSWGEPCGIGNARTYQQRLRRGEMKSESKYQVSCLTNFQ